MRVSLLLLLICLLSHGTNAQGSFELPEVQVTNEEEINSPVLEFSPAYYEDGILFVSTMSPGKKYAGYDKRIKKPTMSIFWAKHDDLTGKLKRPIPFAPELTTKMHEGPLTFDRTAEKVYYTRNDLNRKRRKRAKLKIYESVKGDDGKWSLPSELPFNMDGYETAHPAISADGHTMIFASDRPGGLGGMDLWEVHFKDGQWTEPVNLGPSVNTGKNELFPFLHADGSLFFSSQGHEGLGGLDIFYTLRDSSGRYVKPVNLGAPFNSDKDDLGLIVDRDKKSGYFSSDRDGGAGEDDIYAFDISPGNLDDYLYFHHRSPAAAQAVRFVVTDAMSDAPLQGAEIAVLPLSDSTISPSMLQWNTAGKPALLPVSGDRDNFDILKKRIRHGPRKQVTGVQGTATFYLPKGYYVAYVHKPDYTGIFKLFETGEQTVRCRPRFARDCVPVTGRVVKQNSQAGIPNATVRVLDSDQKLISTTRTDDNGRFDACVNKNQNYQFTAEINGHVIGQIPLSTATDTDVKSYNIVLPANDQLQAYTEGNVIELKNLYFNFNDVSIQPDAARELDQLADILLAHPDIEIEVASYTDAVGSEEYNLNISQRRADRVAEYLIAKGVDSDRILPVGYGESGIRNRCHNGVPCSDREHQYNRRIEIRITKSSIPVKVTYADPSPPPTSLPAGHTGTEADERTPARSSGAAAEGSFHVVIGAFLSARNAQKKARQARNKGLDETFITSYADTPAYHSVVVKTFENYDEALDFAKRLKRKYGFKYYVKRL